MKSSFAREPVSAGLWIATAVILVATVVAFLVIPNPSVATAVATANRNKVQMQKSAEESNRQISIMTTSIKNRDWGIDPAKIIPAAMAQISQAASGNGVALASFRPGRNQNLAYITIVPITISATGTYPQIVNFIKEVEGLKKVNLSAVQISESGQAKDQAMATITAVAYTTFQQVGASDGTN